MTPLQQLRHNIASIYLGHARAVDQMIICLMARGHVLIEDVPGVGKTVLAQTLARSIDCRFARLQLTPDLLPSDILGLNVYSQSTEQFTFKPGPIFANVLLADEINRTTPRTQSALLEAMNENQVSVDGHTHPLEAPFMVVATQNPFEFEGTYVLPESQLDRFMMRIRLGYPEAADEKRVLMQQPSRTLAALAPVISRAQVIQLQKQADEARVDESLVDYIIQFAAATRSNPGLQIGVSPRGTLALTAAARASALLAGRDYVVPDDVIDLIIPVCAHRIIARNWQTNGDAKTSEAILRQIVDSLPVPG